jgi:hypothetical protein
MKKSNNTKKERRKFLADYKLNQEEEVILNEIYNGDNLIEKLMNGKKIRFEVLNELIPKFPDNIDTVTIYIDLFSIIHPLYNIKILEEVHNLVMNDNNKFLISSHLINTAAHFRRYFATRRNCYTNIVFYYSLEKSKNEIEINPNYKFDFYDKRLKYKNTSFYLLNKNIKSNIDICEILSDYLPHIYFINTEEFNPLIVPYHFSQGQGNNELSFIYTDDKVSTLNLLYRKNMNLLYQGYKAISFINNKEDLLYIYSGKENVYENKINSYLLPYIYAISGYNKYNIEGAVPSSKEIRTCNKIVKLIDQGIISNINYNNKDLFINDLANSNNYTEEQLNIIKNNIELFDIRLIYNKLNEADKLKIFNCKDLENINELIKINDNYYQYYPLNLEDILLGEDYESVV